MGRHVEPADFEGTPFAGLRNLPTDFFTTEDHPAYFYEDEISKRPVTIPRELSDIAYPAHTASDANLLYTSDSRELGNKELPFYAMRHEVAESVRENPFTIIVAETGAGKSTQIAQILLNAGFDTIYQTQPRRAAARNVYQRIKEEIGLKLGAAEAADLVSYTTAGEREGPGGSRIKVLTDGLHLERDQLHGDGLGDNDVLVIDEVHEWNVSIEFMVAWAKKEVAKNPNLRVVLMSATTESETLADYLGETHEKRPAIIEVPGRTFDVDWHYRPDSTVVKEAVKAATTIYGNQLQGSDEPNGILVFEPGKREIQDTIEEIRRRLPPDVAKAAKIFPLHAKLSVAEQQAAFQNYPGVKIIVATNVAQTSLTIPDIKYVIDSGYQRRIELDDNGAQGLVLNPISQADCIQRAGRAGRVSDGTYILTRLDEKTDYTPFEKRDAYPMAEILRTDIVRNTLRIAGAGYNIAMLDFYHPVAPEIIDQAQTTLRTLGALDLDNDITELGKKMNQFPVCVTSARMMVEVGRFSENTRAYMAAVVAAKEAGGLPYFAYNAGRHWQSLTEESASDMLAQLDIFIAAQGMTEKEMKDYDLDVHNIERTREQYHKIATKVNAYQEKLLPPTLEEREDLRHCILAGSPTSIYIHQGSGNYRHLGDPDTLRQISNRSLVRSHPAALIGDRYRVEYYANGLRQEKHILENVTSATLSELGKVALGQTEWKSQGLSMRGGKFVDVRRLHLFGVDLGTAEEVLADPSPKLREAVIAHALEHAGPQQTKLRGIKKELERLARLAKDPVNQLTQDQLIQLVHDAAPEDVTDPAVIDNNLRLLMADRNLSLDSFVPAERRCRIEADAPAEIEAEGTAFKVSYQNSRPVVRHYHTRDIAGLHDEIFLPDGRQIWFAHERKRCSLVELQEKLGVSVYAH